MQNGPGSKLCLHNANFTVSADVIAINTSLLAQAPDHRVLQVKARCQLCGMPFEFVGVPISAGPSFDTVTTTPDRLRIDLPIRPGATRLFVVPG